MHRHPRPRPMRVAQFQKVPRRFRCTEAKVMCQSAGRPRCSFLFGDAVAGKLCDKAVMLFCTTLLVHGR